jgi:catechol 2,3-dioxygenase-like lactoylglutathione lyase family enzyme
MLMLQEHMIQTTIPASDFERAKAFYAGKLGFKEGEVTPGGVVFYCGEGSRFLLFPSGGTASGSHTQAGFQVSDIASEVAELQSRGIEFLEYDFPNLKTENGIAKTPAGRSAWFHDSEGNLLGVFQPD